MQDTGAASAAPAANGGMDDLLGGLDDLSVAPQQAPAPPVDDMFGLGGLGATSAPASSPPGPSTLQLLLDASAAHGCVVRGKLVKDGMGQHKYVFGLQNCSQAGMTGFHVQFNKNALGVGLPVGDTSIGIGPLAPGQASETQKDVTIMPDKVDQSQGALLQIALKWTELASSAPFVMIQVRRAPLPIACSVVHAVRVTRDGLQDKIPTDLMNGPQPAASNDDLFGGLL